MYLMRILLLLKLLESTRMGNPTLTLVPGLILTILHLTFMQSTMTLCFETLHVIGNSTCDFLQNVPPDFILSSESVKFEKMYSYSSSSSISDGSVSVSSSVPGYSGF